MREDMFLEYISKAVSYTHLDVYKRQLLGLPETPHRTESYDISNTGSADIVAAQTVFLDGKPLKRDYRYYKLKDMAAPDDYASMDQVLRRRFQRWKDGDDKFTTLPDVILMDGGLGQVRVAVQVLEDFGLSLPVFGMVKDCLLYTSRCV